MAIKLLKRLIWLIIYLSFNVIIFFLEISIFFKQNNKANKSNSGFSLLDGFLNLLNSFFDFIGTLALIALAYMDAILALVAFLLFIPIQIYFINPKYKNNKKFLFSVLASLSVVILLKLIMYGSMLIDTF